jgi:hypothetical protein
MCIILLPANINYDLTEILSIIHIRLYGRLCLVYLISQVTSMLLGDENGIIEFPLQQWLRERAAVSHYTYIACFVYSLHKVYI